MKRSIFIISFTLIAFQSFSQEPVTTADTLRKDALNVFMESTDFIRKEIPYVNYVRDIKDAGVYIISTSQNTGSGGKEYTYFFVGQNQYTGMADTLSFATRPDETEEGTRQKEVNTLKMGLMRYVAKTPLARYMNITFTEPLKETVSTDKWNSWVFRSSIYGYMEGEKSRKQRYLSGSVTASRITENWKVNLNTGLSQNDSKFIITDSTGSFNINASNSSKYFNSLIVKSLNDHWSAGGTVNMGSSSYRNEQFSLSVMPGIEYDIYPYSESTRHQMRLLYTFGYNYVDYTDTTIYNMTWQNLWKHSLSASYEVVQKWGSINLVAEYSNYLHDWSKNNLSMMLYLDLRIAKGLTVSFVGSGSMVHDQLGLVKGNRSLDEVLLQRKEQATQFEYFTSFGFTYTFGSIYNNVVNPRFGNSGGGGISISISD
ncbi:MAG: hypothetical protein MUF36_07310 [Bacteroidales bacterium]|nr:hypothetical protein [Bacteroidales bacterium]